jgi:hypothetical protein
MKDEVIEELWEIKDKIAKQHGCDIDDLANYYIKKSEKRRKAASSNIFTYVAEQSAQPDANRAVSNEI